MLHVAQVAAIRRIAEAVYLTWAGFLFSFSWPISRDFRVQLFFIFLRLLFLSLLLGTVHLQHFCTMMQLFFLYWSIISVR